MPEIKANELISPYLTTAYPRPDYNALDRGKPVGSADTLLNRFVGTAYDKNYIAEWSQDSQRFANDTALSSVGNFAASVGIRTLAGIPSLVGTLWGLVEGGVRAGAGQGKEGLMDALENNPISSLARSIEDFATEYTPQILPEGFSGLSTMQQLASPWQMVKENTESVGFLTQSMLGGGIIARLGIGAATMTALGKTRPLYKALSMLEGPNLAKAAQKIDEFAISAVLGLNEANIEAIDSKDSIKEQLYWGRLTGANTYTDEQVEKIATDNSYNVFWENALTSTVMNMAMARLFRPLMQVPKVASRANPLGLILKDGKAAVKEYKGLSKLIFDKGFAPGRMVREGLIQGVSEGFEENWQYSIQKVNGADKHYDNFWDSMKDYAYSFKDTLNFADDDRLKATVLGSFMGMGHLVVGGAMDLVGLSRGADGKPAKVFSPLGEAIEYKNKQKELVDAFNKHITDNLVTFSMAEKTPQKPGRLYTTEKDGQVKYFNETDSAVEISEQEYRALSEKYSPGEDGRYTYGGDYVLDADGNIKVDEVKRAELVSKAKYHQELQDMIDMELEKGTADPLKLKLYQREQLASFAHLAAQTGTTGVLLDKLDQLENTPDEVLQKQGVTNPAELKADIKSQKDFVTRVESLYNTASNTAIIWSMNSADHVANAERKDHLVRLGMRMITMDDLIMDLDRSIESHRAELGDEYSNVDAATIDKGINALTEVLYNEDKLDTLFKEQADLTAEPNRADTNQELKRVRTGISNGLKKLRQARDVLTKELGTAFDMAKDSAFSRIATEANKRQALRENREELGKMFDELLDVQKGFKAYKTRKAAKNLTDVFLRYKVTNFVIHDAISADEYTAYEQRKVRQLKFKRRMGFTQQGYFSDLVNDIISKWIPEDGVTPEIAQAVSDLLDLISSQGVKIDRATYDILFADGGIVERVYNEIATLEQSVQQQNTRVAQLQREITEYQSTRLDDSEVDALLADLLAQRDNAQDAADRDTDTLEALKSAFAPVVNAIDTLGLDNFLNIYDDLVGDVEVDISENALRTEAFEVILENPKSVLKTSKFDGTNIAEDYDDLERVEGDIESLKLLRDKAIEPLANEDSFYSPFVTELNELISTLETIASKIQANRSDRLLKDRLQADKFATGMLTAFPLLQDGHPLNAELIKSIGAEAYNKLKTLVEDGIDLPLAADAYMDALLTLPEDVVKAHIEETRQSLAEKVKNFPALDAPMPDDVVNAFLLSPNRVFPYIIETLQRSGAGGDLLLRYLRDYDIMGLIRGAAAYAPPSGKATSDNLLELIETYFQLVGLSVADAHLGGTVSSREGLARYKAHLEAQAQAVQKGQGFTPAPSVSQRRTILEIVKFITGPIFSRHFVWDNVMFLKAPAGAGKSTVVAPIAKTIANLGKDRVLGVASQPRAAANIAGALGSTHAPMSFTDLMHSLEAKTLPSGVEVIVLDEAGDMSKAEATEFARALAEYNRNTQKPVKALLLYDPNQVTDSNTGTAAIDLRTYETAGADPIHYWEKNSERAEEVTRLSVGVPYTQNAQQATALSTTFRAPVSEIVDLQNEFKGNANVTGLRSVTNVNPLTNTKGVIGTFVESSPGNLMRILQSSVNENPGRSRVIVVESRQKADMYTQALADANLADKVSVLTTSEVKGLTMDEVYVDIAKGDNPRFEQYGGDTVFSQYMYTATSRAARFLYVANFQTAARIEDPNIAYRSQSYIDTMKNGIQQGIDTTETQINTLDEIFGDRFKTTTSNANATQTQAVDPQENENTPDDSEPEVNEDIENAPQDSKRDQDSVTKEESNGIKNEEVTATDKVYVHKFENPQNEAFGEINIPGALTVPPVEPGNRMYLVREESNGKSRVRVVTPQIATLGDGSTTEVYRTIAILGEDEAVRLSTSIGVDLNAMPAANIQLFAPNDDPRGNILKISNLDTTGPVAIVGNSSHRLLYIYNRVKTNSSPITLKNEGALFVGQTWMAAYAGGANKVQDVFENVGQVMTNWRQHFKIVKWRNQKKAEEEAKSMKLPFVPQVGVPYVVIQGLRLRASKSEVRPQMVRLQSSVLRRGSHTWNKIGGPAIDDFMSTLDKFEQALAGLNIPNVYKEMRNGVPNTVGGERFMPFHSLVIRLSDEFESRRQKNAPGIIELAPTGSSLAATFPPVDSSLFTDEILELASKLDELVHGPREGRKVRNYKGKAQVAFRRIAAQNAVVGLPNGAMKIMRIYRAVNLGEELTEEMDAPSLLGPIKFHINGRAYSPWLNSTRIPEGKRHKFTSYLERYVAKAQERFKAGDVLPSYITVLEDLLRKLNEGQKIAYEYFTLQELKMLFNSVDANKALNNGISGGFGLRAPVYGLASSLSSYDARLLNISNEYTPDGETKVNDAIAELDSTFSGMMHTRMTGVFGGVQTDDQAVPVPEPEAQKPSEYNQLLLDIDKALGTRKTIPENFEFDFKPYSPAILAEFVENVLGLEYLYIDAEAQKTRLQIALQKYLFNKFKPQGTVASRQLIAKIREAIKNTADLLKAGIDAQSVTKLIGIIESTLAVKDAVLKNIGGTDFLRGYLYLSIFPVEESVESVRFYTNLARKYAQHEQHGHIVSALFEQYSQKYTPPVILQRAERMKDLTLAAFSALLHERPEAQAAIAALASKKMRGVTDIVDFIEGVATLLQTTRKMILNGQINMQEVYSLVDAAEDQAVGIEVEEVKGAETKPIVNLAELAEFPASFAWDLAAVYDSGSGASSRKALRYLQNEYSEQDIDKFMYKIFGDRTVVPGQLTAEQVTILQHKLKEYREIVANEASTEMSAPPTKGDPNEKSMIFRTEDEDLGEPLSDEEVQQVIDQLMPPTFMERIKRALFGKRVLDHKRIMKFNRLMNSQGEQVWGLYRKGVMAFATKDGRIGSKVLRHEAFHKIFWEYLDPIERSTALHLAAERWGENLSAEELEEQLANEFMSYFVTRQSFFDVLSDIFRKILRLIGFTFNNIHSIEQFFDDINSGLYGIKRFGGNESVERSMLFVGSAWSLADFTIAKNAYFEVFEGIQAELEGKATIQSLDEQIAYAFEVLKQRYKDPNTPESERAALAPLVDGREPKILQGFIDHFFGDTLMEDFFAFQRKKLDDTDVQDLSDLTNLGAEELTDDEGDVDAEEAEAANLDSETFSTEYRDPKVKITGRVKHRLSTITYNDVNPLTQEVEPVRGDFDRVFSVVLEFVHMSEIVDVNSVLSNLKSRLNAFSFMLDNKSFSDVRTATGVFLLKFVQRLENHLNSPSRRRDIVIRKDVNSKNYYAIYAKDKSTDVSNVTYSEAIENPEAYKVVTINKGEPLINLANAIIDSQDNLPGSLSMWDIKTAYEVFEDLNFVKSLVAAVSSLRQANPQIGQHRLYFGEYKSSTFKNKYSAGDQILSSRAIGAFVNAAEGAIRRFAKAGEPQDIVPSDLQTRLAQAKDNVNKQEKDAEIRKVVAEVLKSVGLDAFADKVQRLSRADVKRLIGPLFYAVQDINAAARRGMAETADITPESLEQLYDEIFSAANDQGSFASAFIFVFGRYWPVMYSNSYMKGNGKIAYGFQDASYQSELLSLFNPNFENNRSHGRIRVQEVGNNSASNGFRIQSNDPFIRRSIYTDLASIYEVVDHDSLRRQGAPEFSIELQKEKELDFHRRNIVHGFIDVGARNSGRSYIQWLPNPANRPNIQGARVSLLTMADAEKAVDRIISNEMDRPDPGSNPELAKSSVYKANWRTKKLAGLSGRYGSKESVEANRKRVMQHVKSEASRLAKQFFPEKMDNRMRGVHVDHGKLEKLADSLKKRDPNFKFPSGYKRRKQVVEQLNAGTLTEEQKRAHYDRSRQLMENVLQVFYANYIVNQYSLSQLMYGDETFYKNKEDQIKRIQVATASGDVLLVDNQYGIPPQSKVVVMQDVKEIVPEDLENVRDDSYREDFAATDGEGFMLPEFYEKVAAAYGVDAKTDVIMKPVYFSVDPETGMPMAIKYSVKVLTDALVEKFPHLAALRTEMRRVKADQAVFASAIKVSVPLNKAKMSNEGVIIPNTVDNSLLTIDNRNLRFQLNPAKSPDVTTRNPSQATAFMNTNGMNETEWMELMDYNALLIENGLRTVTSELKLTEKGTLVKSSQVALRRKLLSVLEDLPGAQDLYNLLSTKNRFTGEYEVDFSLPMVAQRAVSMVASAISRSTVGFRFPGSKLVLQADYGTKVFRDENGNLVDSRLKYKDENGYTEVFLPDIYREHFKSGDVVSINDGIVGFRIPSTNYHSLLALKVKGFYPAPEGSDANVIIAPSLLVYYHGSDYDVDTLFLLRKESLGSSMDVNALLKKYDLIKESDPALDIKTESIPGFTANANGDQIAGQALPYFLEKKVIELTRYFEDLKRKGVELKGDEKAEHNKKIDEARADLTTLRKVLEVATKNSIVHLYSTNLRDSKNRKDLLTPISFAIVGAIKSEKLNEFKSLLTDESTQQSFLQELEEAGIIQLNC